MTNRAALKDLAKQVWDSLPEGRRGSRKIAAMLAKQGVKVAPSSIERWFKEWNTIGHAAAALVIPPPKNKDEAPPADLEAVPDDLATVLPAHIMKMARGRGLDRVENAIVAVVDQITKRADVLVDDDDKLKTIVSGLAAFSQALQIIAQARAVVSTAHRNFAEGDRLRAEARHFDAAAEKLAAEAEDIRRATRGPTTIPGESTPVSPLTDAIDSFHRAARPANVS